jgi:Rho-binding antiterminator
MKKITTMPCELHDYLEIACLYGYRVKLTLKDRKTIEGLAINMITTDERREFLLIENKGIHEIDLNQLSQMKVLTPNAKFSDVTF